MADLNLARRAADGTGGVVKQHLLLRWGHQSKQRTGLRVVVRVLAMVPMVSRAL